MAMKYKFSLPEGITVNLIDDVPVSLEWRVQCDAYEQLDAEGNPVILSQADMGYKVDSADIPGWPLTPAKQKALVKKYMKAPGNNDQIASAEASHAAWIANEPVIPAPVRRIDELKESAAPEGQPPALPIASTEVTEFSEALE